MEIDQWLGTIKDAYDETRELVHSANRTKSTDNEDNEDKGTTKTKAGNEKEAVEEAEEVDGDDDGSWSEGKGFSDQELKRASSCLVFIKNANQLVGMLHKLVTLSVGESNSDQDVNTLENLVIRVKSIASQVDDVGCLIYPPHDVDQLVRNSTELHTALLSLMNTIDTLNPTLFLTVKKNNSSKIMELMRKQLDQAIQDISTEEGK